jgi:sugar/nucleoside kinase (ribokinase family)
MTKNEPVPEYLVIGHVTQDLVPEGGYRQGGTATYAALAALYLGKRVGVLTSVGAGIEPFPQNSVWVQVRPSPQSTVFENIYMGRARKQYVRGVADVLTPQDLPAAWRRAPIVHLGPVAQEVSPELAEAFDDALIGVTPQGWLRRWDDDGLVLPAEWPESERILDAAHVVVLSLEDLGGDRPRLEALARRARLLVLTLGEQGALVYQHGGHQRVPAFEVEEVDPTGAGDVFATGFLIRYAETGDAIEAARFANCVASFVVQGIGPANLPSREQVEERLEHGRIRG